MAAHSTRAVADSQLRRFDCFEPLGNIAADAIRQDDCEIGHLLPQNCDLDSLRTLRGQCVVARQPAVFETDHSVFGDRRGRELFTQADGAQKQSSRQ